jgi:ComF family protein
MLSIPSSLCLPKICIVCQMYFQSAAPICFYCENYLKPLDNSCSSCGNSQKNGYLYCSNCLKSGSLIHQFFAPYLYTEPLKTLINQFKFKHGLFLLKYLGNLILKYLPKECLKTECLIPVPLHSERLKKRGFNQTLLLAHYLGKKLNIPVAANYCQKKTITLPQSELSREERLQNLKNSFYCTKIPFKHITLIDDVCTTSTTLNTLAENFLSLGVNTIDAWVIAKV